MASVHSVYCPGDVTRLSTLTLHERNALTGVYDMVRYCEARMQESLDQCLLRRGGPCL